MVRGQINTGLVCVGALWMPGYDVTEGMTHACNHSASRYLLRTSLRFILTPIFLHPRIESRSVSGFDQNHLTFTLLLFILHLWSLL
jgi:hypothetical protein